MRSREKGPETEARRRGRLGVQGQGDDDTRAGAGCALQPHGGAQPAGPRLHVGEAVARPGGVRRIEAAAIVLHEQADCPVVPMQTHRDGRGRPMAEAVADGLAHDLERFGGMFGRQQRDGLGIHIYVEAHGAAGAQFGGESLDGLDKASIAEVLGREAVDIGAHLANRGVEALETLGESAVRLSRILADKGAGRLDGEPRGVERLDDPVCRS